MRRDQLEHAIRTACQIIDRSEVIVVGSQAILGTFSEDVLPADATMSVEVDILPIADSNDETARLADLIEGVAGEFSTFEALHGFSIDGVDLETSALPDGWRDRLMKVQNANTAAPAGQPQLRLMHSWPDDISPAGGDRESTLNVDARRSDLRGGNLQPLVAKSCIQTAVTVYRRHPLVICRALHLKGVERPKHPKYDVGIAGRANRPEGVEASAYRTALLGVQSLGPHNEPTREVP
jgi:hypothetical protein